MDYKLVTNTCLVCQPISMTDLQTRSEIVPLLWPTKFDATVLSITYGTVSLQPASVLTPTQVKDYPTVQWNKAGHAYYTLIMTDPDAPSRQDCKFREFVHWTVVNIPSTNLKEGQEIVQYLSSGPGQGTGLHRYTFFLFGHSNKIEVKDAVIPNTTPTGRRSFNTFQYAQKHGLGSPLAWNYFEAEWDEYVPIVRKQLGLA